MIHWKFDGKTNRSVPACMLPIHKGDETLYVAVPITQDPYPVIDYLKMKCEEGQDIRDMLAHLVLQDGYRMIPCRNALPNEQYLRTPDDVADYVENENSKIGCNFSLELEMVFVPKELPTPEAQAPCYGTPDEEDPFAKLAEKTDVFKRRLQGK